MDEIKFKIGTLKVDSAAQIVMGRPAQAYLNGFKAACATGEKDGDGNQIYLFDDLTGDVTDSYVNEQDAACINTVLTAIGYSEATAFDRNVLEGIFDISTIVPAVGFVLLAVILWFWYPLHKKQVNENVQYLENKHKK